MSATDAGIFETVSGNEQQISAHYDEQGWFLVRNFFDYDADILPIHVEINKLIELKLAQLGLEPGTTESHREIRREDFKRICEADRARGGEIYRACRHLCPLIRLSVAEKVVRLAQSLMRTDTLNLIPYTAVRIDVPGEEQYLFPWHQDYPYTQGSVDGVIFWTPFFDVSRDEGAVRLIPGSHKRGLQQVEVLDPENASQNGAHTIRMADTTGFEESDYIQANVNAGDLLVFHTLAIHRSTENKSDNIRWTTQLRYANFENQDALERGWPGGMIEGNNFEKDHPEFIASRELQ